MEELKISEYPTPEPPVLLTVISMLPPVIFSLANVNSILYLRFSTEHSLTELSAGGASIYLKFNSSTGQEVSSGRPEALLRGGFSIGRRF